MAWRGGGERDRSILTVNCVCQRKEFCCMTDHVSNNNKNYNDTTVAAVTMVVINSHKKLTRLQ